MKSISFLNVYKKCLLTNKEFNSLSALNELELKRLTKCRMSFSTNVLGESIVIYKQAVSRLIP